LTRRLDEEIKSDSLRNLGFVAGVAGGKISQYAEKKELNMKNFALQNRHELEKYNYVQIANPHNRPYRK
jgi:hypothetical protein